MAAVIIKQKDVKRLATELLNEMFDFLHNDYIITEFKEMKEVQNEFLNKLKLNGILESKELFNLITNKKSFPEDDSIIEGIFHTLNSLKLNMEINEDLYYKTKAFLGIYRVFESGYIYLED